MRLLIKLRANKEQSYEMRYHHKLQGFIYELLSSDFGELHDKRGYKFFCFSNIFPIKDMEEGEKFSLLISSPLKNLVFSLEKALPNIVNVGEMSFELVEVKKLEMRIRERARVLTATPVIIRIPERNYERYGIPEDERNLRYVYWRPKYPFDAFLKQVSENLIKKFNEFHGHGNGAGIGWDNLNLFEQFVFRRGTATNVVIGGKEYVMVGSMWEFRWSHMDETRRRIIEFGLDAGFGERNSLGFGFVNRV